jgi:uncharacterized integral membrane protein
MSRERAGSVLGSRRVTEIPSSSAGGSRWRLYVAIGAIVLAAIFILQNSQEVRVDFIFTTTETPLVFALLFAAILGFVIGLALPRFRRRD